MSRKSATFSMLQPSANTSVAATGAAPSRVGGRALTVAIVLSAICLAGLVWSLRDLVIDRSGGSVAAASNLQNLWPYWLASGLCWISLTILWMALERQQRTVNVNSRWLAPAAAVMSVAIATRVVVLITHEPSLSDDVYRYVYDGRTLASGFNPYLEMPRDRINSLASGGSERWRGERASLDIQAYPDLTTPYLPLSQYSFGALALVCERGDWVSIPASTRVFRIGFVICEFALMLMLLAALRARSMSPWWLALYAWHPMPVSEISGSGHEDITGIALLVAGLMLCCPRKVREPATIASDESRDAPSPRGDFRSLIGMGVFAASAMVKPLAVLAAPMALRGRPIRQWLISLGIGGAICIALALPLRWLPGQAGFASWQGTAHWLTEKAAHFGGLYEPVLCIVRHTMTGGDNPEPGFNLKQEWLARKICLGVFVLMAAAIFFRVRDCWQAAAAALLALALCSTTCNPWYVVWSFALFPLARSWTLWVYSLTITWGYVVFVSGKGHALGVEWTVTPWVLAAAYGLVAAAVVVDVAIHCRLRPRQRTAGRGLMNSTHADV